MAEDPNEPRSESPSRPRSTSRPPQSGRRVEALPDPATLVEVYRTDNEILALFVRDEILSPAGIYSALHRRMSNAIMAPASMPGQIGIAVASEHAQDARTRLITARKDGVLLDGELIAEDVA